MIQYGDGLPLGRRRLVVGTVAITTVLSVLDGTISNVALPTIAQDLRVTSAAVVWVVNAFMLISTMLLVPLSSLGDIIGFARIYRIGVAIFVVASVFCATAHDLPSLIAARTVQGIGAAGILSSSQPIARFAFPATMLGLAIGIQGVIVSTSSAAGPAIGGLILGVGSWPWLFWINVPLGLIALALSGLLPVMPRATHRFDWPSAVLSGLTIAFFITGLDQLRAPSNVTLFALELGVTAVLGTLAVRRQGVLDPPFLAVDLLRVRIIRLSLVVSFLGFMAQSMTTIVLPFFFHALGYTASATGFLMTPFPLGTALVALFAGRLSDRYDPGILGAIGLVTLAIALALLALLPAHPSTVDIVWRTALGGAGFGIFVSPNLRAMVGAAPRQRSGAITGLTVSARLTGQTTGVAAAAVLFGAGIVGEPTMRVVLGCTVALTLAALAVSSLRIEGVRGRISDP